MTSTLSRSKPYTMRRALEEFMKHEKAAAASMPALDHAYDLAALALAKSESEASPRPMDTAPQDGTPVLGFVQSYYQGKGAWVVVLWMGTKGMRDAGWMDNRAWLVKPQCWLPLPEARK